MVTDRLTENMRRYLRALPSAAETPLFAVEVGITKPIGWHTFRRTFSMLVASLGVEAKVVQELMHKTSSAVGWIVG